MPQKPNKVKKFKLYQVDAFAEAPFSGNPAAVVVLDNWLEDKTLQNIAMENNLSETAFIIEKADHYLIRYFTPLNEVELCGHATLASAYVVINHMNPGDEEITFRTQKRGDLFVKTEGEILVMNFPTDIYKKVDVPEGTEAALGLKPIEAYWGLNDLMLIYNSEEEIAQIVPNPTLLKNIKARGVLVTAKGTKVDFVSRFFAPLEGIDEDPVTGSAHTTLIPYWHEKTGKKQFVARQLSKRGGILYCNYLNDRVEIGGKARPYLEGILSI